MMMSRYRFCLYLLVIATILYTIADSTAKAPESKYAVVVDAGSTGNRAYLFRVHAKGTRNVDVLDREMVEPGIADFASEPSKAKNVILPLLIKISEHIPLEQRSMTTLFVRATGGMRTLSDADQHAIWEALQHGLSVDPSNPFPINPKNFGTIDGKMEAYYAVIAANYVAGRIDGSLHPVVNLNRDAAAAEQEEDEKQEGNYEGSKPQGKTQALIGALDMGGSSTQMIYHKGGAGAQPDDFWSHSWTSFGVSSAKEKVWAHIVASTAPAPTAAAAIGVAELSVDGDVISASDSGNSNKSIRYYPNPCTFRGHEETVQLPLMDGDATATSSAIFVGSGDPMACAVKIRETLWGRLGENSASKLTPRHQHSCLFDDHYVVTPPAVARPVELADDTAEAVADGIRRVAAEHDLEGMEVVSIKEGDDEGEDEDDNDGDIDEDSKRKTKARRVPCPMDDVAPYSSYMEDAEFYAMSVYFFAFDCIHNLGPEALAHWPNPSIAELESAAHKFCTAYDWEHVSSHLMGRHAFTMNNQISLRCFESLYLVTILKHAFGFDDAFRGINFAPHLNGVAAVEWPLGFLLTHISVEHSHVHAHAHAHDSHTHGQ